MTTQPNRRLFNVPLEPVSGSIFQPTGFPDIGTAVFDRPVRDDAGNTTFQSALLVESAQSMANRLEGMAWDDGTLAPVALFDGLPYVRIIRGDGGEYVTSSRTEAHRLASAFVKDADIDDTKGKAYIKDKLALVNDLPIPARRIAAAVFGLDPFCLLHGVFFADKEWPGQPKIARAVSASIEAHDVRRVDSGGVKKDHVRHSLGDSSGGTAEGYGTVPFHRTEWTAAEIVATFNVDLGQIRSYGLGDAGYKLLEAIALWEIRTMLDGAIRLRTACDLQAIDDEIVDRAGVPLPSADDLAATITSSIAAVSELVGSGKALEATWTPTKAAKS